MDHDEKAQEKEKEPLPNSIWLRGDEDFFEDFCLDAEEVMSQLGIKRSRLRQISGHELRVGRKRVDRYIKPFYRPKDVEDYLAWTRATASHQKSSLILNTAADSLSSHSKKISESILDLKEQATQAFQDIPERVSRGFSNSKKTQFEILNHIQKNQASLQKGLQKNQNDILENVLPHISNLKKIINKTEDKISKFETINQAFLEAISLIQSNYSELKELKKIALKQDLLMEKICEDIHQLKTDVKMSHSKHKKHGKQRIYYKEDSKQAIQSSSESLYNLSAIKRAGAAKKNMSSVFS